MNMVNFAAQVCGMAQPGRGIQSMPTKPVNKLEITNSDTKGMEQYSYIGSEGLELDCYLEYEAAYDGGTGPNSEESWPESIRLVYALHKGEDISEVLSDDIKALIEEEALADLHQQDRENCSDAAIERYISRMECQA